MLLGMIERLNFPAWYGGTTITFLYLKRNMASLLLHISLAELPKLHMPFSSWTTSQ